MSHDQIDRIRDQFTRQSEAYARLSYVSDDAALGRIVSMSGADPSKDALDVACGPGFIAMALARHCRQVAGVDATAAFLDMATGEASRRGIENVRFVEGNVETMEFDDEAFDIVVCRAAFHHFPHPAKVLREMIRVAKSDGTILVLDMVTSDDPAKAAYHHELEVLCDPTHARALSDSEFRELFANEGLEVRGAFPGKTKYTLDSWLEHGAPSQENEARIRELVNDCLEDDLCGMPVWQDEGTTYLAHKGMAYVLSRPDS